jgi:hypothetical protein
VVDVLEVDESATDVDGPDVDGLDDDGADVDGPDVDGPDVDGPDVDGPDVDGPDVDGPDVDGLDVEGADVEGADVDGLDVDGADVDGSEVEVDESATVVDAPDVLGPDASTVEAGAVLPTLSGPLGAPTPIPAAAKPAAPNTNPAVAAATTAVRFRTNERNPVVKLLTRSSSWHCVPVIAVVEETRLAKEGGWVQPSIHSRISPFSTRTSMRDSFGPLKRTRMRSAPSSSISASWPSAAATASSDSRPPSHDTVIDPPPDW